MLFLFFTTTIGIAIPDRATINTPMIDNAMPLCIFPFAADRRSFEGLPVEFIISFGYSKLGYLNKVEDLILGRSSAVAPNILPVVIPKK